MPPEPPWLSTTGLARGNIEGRDKYREWRSYLNFYGLRVGTFVAEPSCHPLSPECIELAQTGTPGDKGARRRGRLAVAPRGVPFPQT